MDEASSTALRDALIREQNSRNLTDVAFAELLNIPRSTWTLTRQGRKTVGLRVARAAWSRFEHLRPLTQAFFFGSAVPVGTATPEQSAQPAVAGAR